MATHLSAQFIRYVVVGLTSFVLDMILLVLTTEVLGISPVFAVIVSQLLVLLYNFSLNKCWSFSHRACTRRAMIRYAILTVANYMFGIVAMYVGHTILDIDYRIVRILTVGIMVTWNFLLYRHWVYKHE